MTALVVLVAVVAVVMDAAAWVDTVCPPYRGEPVTPMTWRLW